MSCGAAVQLESRESVIDELKPRLFHRHAEVLGVTPRWTEDQGVFHRRAKAPGLLHGRAEAHEALHCRKKAGRFFINRLKIQSHSQTSRKQVVFHRRAKNIESFTDELNPRESFIDELKAKESFIDKLKARESFIDELKPREYFIGKLRTGSISQRSSEHRVFQRWAWDEREPLYRGALEEKF